MSFDVEIRSLTAQAQGEYSRAKFDLRVGPLIIREARIMEKNGERWIALPAKRTSNGRWYPQVVFADQANRQEIEQLALAEYERVMQQPLDIPTF